MTNEESAAFGVIGMFMATWVKMVSQDKYDKMDPAITHAFAVLGLEHPLTLGSSPLIAANIVFGRYTELTQKPAPKQHVTVTKETPNP